MEAMTRIVQALRMMEENYEHLGLGLLATYIYLRVARFRPEPSDVELAETAMQILVAKKIAGVSDLP